MNQTKKRLTIINLAISMTDIETIQLQILKLGPLKSDENIQEIIHTLYDENYAQAQALIKTYIDTPHHEILQRTFQIEKEKMQRQQKRKPIFPNAEPEYEEINERIEEETAPKKTEKELMHEFKLLNSSNVQEPSGTTLLSLDDMLNIHQKSVDDTEEERAKKKVPEINFDTLLNIKSDDVMPNNIDIDISTSEKKDFWKADKDELPKPKDTAFWNEHDDSELKPDPQDNDTFFTQSNENEEKQEEEVQTQQTEVQEVQSHHEDLAEHTVDDSEEKEEESDLQEETETSKKENINYPPISYIDQKLKNMQVQYPGIATSDESFASVEQWLLQISKEGYTEEDIVEMIEQIERIKTDNKSEAAQLLLITAATRSPYSQFRLARALYKGEILKQNLPEAFTIINRLAMNDDYPEAICDLAQFYEHGVGIGKDKKKAEHLYREAMELGIKRAEAHVERLGKGNKKFFSFLTK